MAQDLPQNFENHVRWVPAYHFVGAGILMINLIWSLYKIVTDFSGDRVIGLLLAFALFILFFYARNFSITVQNRVVRLEMNLRLEKILPPDLRPRIREFSLDQLIALRFAGDDELVELARKVLQDKNLTPKEIKKMVKNWVPDYLRA